MAYNVYCIYVAELVENHCNKAPRTFLMVRHFLCNYLYLHCYLFLFNLNKQSIKLLTSNFITFLRFYNFFLECNMRKYRHFYSNYKKILINHKGVALYQ